MPIPSTNLSPEYQEFIEQEKEALRACIRKSRVIPGIPIHEIARVLVEELSYEEQQYLAGLLTIMNETKGGEDM